MFTAIPTQRSAFAISLAETLDHLTRAATRQERLRRAARSRKRTERALRALDARLLRDIGLSRGEIDSMAREVAGEIEPTRRHVRPGLFPRLT